MILLFGCTEPYLLQTSNFEEALVIEATITNELKTQQIRLTKTYRLEENGPEFVENANISVEDDFGNVYNFTEGNEVYESQNPFQAIAGRRYKLRIIVNGKTYTSTPEVLSAVNPIQNVEVHDVTIAGDRGAEIKVKSFDPTGNSKYYRYEFEETYKVIAPKWKPNTVTINPNFNALGSKDLIFTPRTYEAQTCYSTFKSNELLLHSTSNLSEDRVDYMVRFIHVTNPIIKHRYSILVNQYVQNLESYTYYSTLKSISGSGSILSQNQPGFFRGNITCESNPNEKVIGFFDVSSKSSQRIFFNFADVFPGTTAPGYFYDCYDNCVDEPGEYNCPGVYNFCFEIGNPNSTCEGENVEAQLNTGNLLYYSGPNPIYLVPLPCGDCTQFSSNVVPTFWQ
ncbi:DUF4249 domain-containing protein [Flavobacterium terrigena]